MNTVTVHRQVRNPSGCGSCGWTTAAATHTRMVGSEAGDHAFWYGMKATLALAPFPGISGNINRRERQRIKW
jgi:hypothetical protein